MRALLLVSLVATMHGTGFTMPSKLVQCAYLGAPSKPGLYCSASYITRGAYDHRGVVWLPTTGKARIVTSGNDLLLYLGGWRGGRKKPDPRPTLAYGSTWSRAGFSCTSARSGVTCKHGGHGLHLARGHVRLY
jgi:hypothetical protein